jgi:hypothetical protein
VGIFNSESLLDIGGRSRFETVLSFRLAALSRFFEGAEVSALRSNDQRIIGCDQTESIRA